MGQATRTTPTMTASTPLRTSSHSPWISFRSRSAAMILRTPVITNATT